MMGLKVFDPAKVARLSRRTRGQYPPSPITQTPPAFTGGVRSLQALRKIDACYLCLFQRVYLVDSIEIHVLGVDQADIQELSDHLDRNNLVFEYRDAYAHRFRERVGNDVYARCVRVYVGSGVAGNRITFDKGNHSRFEIGFNIDTDTAHVWNQVIKEHLYLLEVVNERHIQCTPQCRGGFT